MLYTKAGCHLCAEARAGLWELARQGECDLVEIDIRSDAELFERYRHRVPVVTLAGRVLMEGALTEAARQRLRGALRPGRRWLPRWARAKGRSQGRGDAGT